VIGKVWAATKRLLIPDFPPPYTVSFSNLRIPSDYQKKVTHIGPILPVHPDELPSQREIRRELDLNEGRPLIFAPISGPTKERAYFTGILRQIFKEIPNDYQIVMSLGYPNTSAEPVQNGNLTVYKWIPNRFEYLKACDLVIARAGHGTLTQSICYGKPLILVPTPSHTEQLNNAKMAVQLGIAQMIEQKDLNKEMLLETIQKMLRNTQFQERVQQIQREVLKLNGVEVAVQAILEVTEDGSS
jgi:UDP:flavonoid glycosyltransferase YjiC (YdhE family)